MAQSPRTTEDIIVSLSSTHETIDATIDIQKGPISVLLYAFAAELARVEQFTSYLTTLYNMDRIEDFEEDDIENIGRNYGKDPFTGDAAEGIVTFYRFDTPESTIQYYVPSGTLVSTSDIRYVFSVIDDVVMNGSAAEVYYNPDTRRYEVNAKVAAISAGDDFNVPPGVIDQIASDVPDFDGVINMAATRNGADPFDVLQFRNIIWEAMQGLNPAIYGRVVSTILEADPVNTDNVSIVPSADFENFARLKMLNGTVAYDFYVITDNISEEIQSDFANGGEQSIILQKRPVNSVEYVLVNGQSVPFAFNPDTDPATRGSGLSNDRVALTTPLLPAQRYEIKYFSYAAISDSQNQLDSDQSPFGAELLIRLADPVPVYIGGTIGISTVSDKDTTIETMRLFTSAWLKSPGNIGGRQEFIDSLDPAEYQSAMRENVIGLTRFSLTNFVRMDQALADIEQIVFNGLTEYPLLSPNFDIT